MKLYAVIMAGGSGTRFWPLSRGSRPKQFLPVTSPRSMLEETVDRLAPLIPASRILTIAGEDHTRSIRELVPALPEANLLVEPLGKNTAPSLLLATADIYLRDPEAVVAALPADHLIRDTEKFRECLQAAAAAAYAEDLILTFGIPPTYPATGYGYIQFDPGNPGQFLGSPVYRVREFKEKPDAETARVFLEDGGYFWNSGIFLWKASTFEDKLRRYAPDLFSFWEEMLHALDRKNLTALAEIFHRIPADSIDYALMEKAQGIGMCRGDFGWSDVGSWASLFEVWEMDADGNAARGPTRNREARNCLVFNPGRTTVLIGVEDLIVVNTDDALLICRRDRDQDVKAVVQELEKSGKKTLL